MTLAPFALLCDLGLHDLLSPARTGNRPRPAMHYHRKAAHPRSCGEQCRCGRPPRTVRGSSPLARGTDHRRAGDDGRCRLIPARAGNRDAVQDAHTATGDIRAVEFTSSREGDSPVLPDLLDQIPPDEQIGTVTGDGAFDTRRCHVALLDRGGTAVIPIRKNVRLWKEDCPAARARNDILRASKRFGRATWKHWSGYHVRSRIEAKMRCLKSFGERIASRDPDRQTAEVHIRIALMNRCTALGTAEIKRLA